jgi:tetratricopeptide (TPR) repeat protein
VNLLLSPEIQRFDDALIIAETCLKLDPYNGAVINLVNQLRGWKKDRGAQATKGPNLQQLEKEAQDDPANFQKTFNLASAYLQMQMTDRAMRLLDSVLDNPRADLGALRGVMDAYAQISRPKLQSSVEHLQASVQAHPTNFQMALGLAEGYRQLQQPDKAAQTLDAIVANPSADENILLQIAQSYQQMANMPKIESTLEQLVKRAPDLPEAWYDLAGLKSRLNKTQEALPALKRALELSDKRHQQDPKAHDLAAEVQKDPQFASLRQTPEFQKIIPSK